VLFLLLCASEQPLRLQLVLLLPPSRLLLLFVRTSN
jgi:hypothetical protein